MGGSLLAVTSVFDGSLACSHAAHFESVSLFCTRHVGQLQPVGFGKFFQSKPPILLMNAALEVVAVAELFGTLFFALPQAAHSALVFLLRTKHSGHSHVSAAGLNLSPQLEATTGALSTVSSLFFEATIDLAGNAPFIFCGRGCEHFEHSSAAAFIVKHFIHVQLVAFGELLLLLLFAGAISFDRNLFIATGESFVCLDLGDDLIVGIGFFKDGELNEKVVLTSLKNALDVDGLAADVEFAAGDCVDLLSLATLSAVHSSSFSSKFSNSNGFENTNSSVTSNFGKLEIFNTAFGKFTGLGLSSNLLSFLRVSFPTYWLPVSLDSLDRKRIHRC